MYVHKHTHTHIYIRIHRNMCQSEPSLWLTHKHVKQESAVDYVYIISNISTKKTAYTPSTGNMHKHTSVSDWVTTHSVLKSIYKPDFCVSQDKLYLVWLIFGTSQWNVCFNTHMYHNCYNSHIANYSWVSFVKSI